MEKDQINDLARAALDAACAHIQDALGVKTGDFAALHFSARQREETILQILAFYIEEEIIQQMPIYNTYLVHRFHAVEIKVFAESALEAVLIAESDPSYRYTLTAAFDNHNGGPPVYPSNHDTEVTEK
jgi:hypothetical protein